MSPRHSTLVLAGFVCLGAATGCSGGEPVHEAGPESRGSFALIHVERTRFDGGLLSSRYEHAEVSGRIARFAGLDRERVAAILGFEDIDEPIELDACESPAPATIDGDLAIEEIGRAAVELIDVGSIEMRAGNRFLRLEPQSFPGLLNVLSGAVYGADEGEGVEWSSGLDYTFLTAGSDQVGGFEALGSAPEELTVLRVGGEDPTLTVPAIERTIDLPIRWEPGDAHDTIRIDLGWNQLGTDMGMRCYAVDDGNFAVTTSVLRQVPDGTLAVSPRLSVRRIRRRPFVAPGLDEGLLMFELSETYAVRIR